MDFMVGSLAFYDMGLNMGGGQLKDHPVYKRGFNRQLIGNSYSVLAQQQNLKSFPAPEVLTKKLTMRCKNF